MLLRTHFANKRNQNQNDCISPALEYAFDYLSLGLFITDTILFRGNFWVLVFVVVPTFSGFSIRKQTAGLENLAICSEDKSMEV